MCLSKSPNKHNRLFLKGMPLGDELSSEIEKETMGPKAETKTMAKRLVEEYDWDKTDSMKVWCYGPDNNGPNMVVDVAKGV